MPKNSNMGIMGNAKIKKSTFSFYSFHKFSSQIPIAGAKTVSHFVQYEVILDICIHMELMEIK